MATNIEKLIISHNKDAQNRKMVAFYDRKSTMEKMGIARSETAHSAFLANLLKSNNGLGLEESAIMWLLHILIEREDNATAYNSTSSKSPIPTDVKAAVLSQTLKYDIEEITTEKVIDELSILAVKLNIYVEKDMFSQKDFFVYINENYINESNIPTERIVLFYASGLLSICLEEMKDPTSFNKDNILKYFENLIPTLDFLKPIKQ